MEGLATIGSPDDWLAHPGTVGRAATALGIEVVILDDDGNEVAAGVPGLVYMRPPSGQRFEYEGAPESTASAWRDDLFTVGDVGYLDEEGLLFLIDRQKDVVITGGINVYPAEVERVLTTHPSVSEAAVIGVPDDEWGESVVAVVVTDRARLCRRPARALPRSARELQVPALDRVRRRARGRPARQSAQTRATRPLLARSPTPDLTGRRRTAQARQALPAPRIRRTVKRRGRNAVVVA